MPTRGRLTLDLAPYFEALQNAEQNVDEVAAELFEQNKYNALMLMIKTLRETSETWTNATARTVFVDGPLHDGNYVYLEMGAHTEVDPAGWYKEFGRPNQAAEPFLRPTLQYYRKTGLRQTMQAILEKYGLGLK